MPHSCDDHQADALHYLAPLSDYSAEEARGAFGGRVAYPRSRPRRCMFTVKPANDTEEFYEAIEKYRQENHTEHLRESTQEFTFIRAITRQEKNALEIAIRDIQNQHAALVSDITARSIPQIICYSNGMVENKWPTDVQLALDKIKDSLHGQIESLLCSVRNHQNLPLRVAPFSSEASTFPSPSQPRADDAP